MSKLSPGDISHITPKELAILESIQTIQCNVLGLGAMQKLVERVEKLEVLVGQ